MKGFEDLGVFAAFLAARALEVKLAARHGLREGAALVREDARSRIGTYQSAVGPFAGWAPLSEKTQLQRERLGFTPDDPLARNLELHKHITAGQEGDLAVVGVQFEQVGDGSKANPTRNIGYVAMEQELGGEWAPPRPFLGPAGFTQGEKVAHMIAQAVTLSLAGEK